MDRFARRGGFILLFVLSLLLPARHAAAQDDAATLERIAAITAGAPALDEGFRADEGDWELYAAEDYALRYDGGSYRVDVPDPDQFVWGIHQGFAAGDFYAEVDAYTVAGPENNQVGFVFRHADTDNFYVFAISADGQYELLRFAGGAWAELVTRAPSDAVNAGAGAVNRLGVLAEGSAITLLINGAVVGRVEDAGLPSGAVGLAAGAFAEGGVYAAFDDLRLWPLGEAGDVPTPEPTEEPIEAPTAEPTPEATPEAPPDVRVPPQDAAARLEEIRRGPPLLSEQFRRDTGAWSLDSDDTVTYRVTGRSLNVEMISSNWMGWSVATGVSAGDLLFEADATLRAGPEDAEFGLLVRESPGDNGGNFYFFAVTAQGYYSFWKSVGGAWTALVPWTASDAIAPGLGATNRLGVLAEGATFTLVVNDQPLAQVDDATFAEGRVALAVGTFDTGGAEVAFDNVTLWALGGGPIALPTIEPLPTVEPLPTIEPLPTLEPQTDDTGDLEAIRATTPTYTGDFNRDRGDWSMAVDEGVLHAYARRTFRIRIDLDAWMSWSVNEALNAPDFLVEVDAARVAGPTNGAMGIVFSRVDDDNFYYFAVNSARQFSLWQRVGGEWASVLLWIEVSALNGGDATLNRIGVLKRGGEIKLLGNGFVLATITVDGAAGGDIGLAVETVGEPGVEISFDDLRYWDLTQ